MNATSSPPPAAESLWFRFFAQYGSTAWVRLFSFAVVVLVLPRCLDKPGLATVILALTFLEVLALVSDAGFSQLATLRFDQDPAEGARLMGQALRWRLAVVGAALGLTWLAAVRDATLPGTELLLAGLTLAPYAWVQNARSYWNARRRIGPLQAMSTVAYTLGHLAAALAALAGGSERSVLLGLLGSFWAEWLLIAWFVRPEPERCADWRLYGWSWPAGAGWWRELRRALPYGLFGMAWMIYLRLDVFLVQALAPAELAEYGLALKLYSFVLTLIQGGVLVLLADSRRISGGLTRLTPKRLGLLAGLLIGAVGLFVWGPPLLASALPASYAGVAGPTRWLTLAGYLQAGSLALGILILGGEGGRGQVLWKLYLVACGLVALLGVGEVQAGGRGAWAENRLIVDGLLLAATLWIYRCDSRHKAGAGGPAAN